MYNSRSFVTALRRRPCARGVSLRGCNSGTPEDDEFYSIESIEKSKVELPSGGVPFQPGVVEISDRWGALDSGDIGESALIDSMIGDLFSH